MDYYLRLHLANEKVVELELDDAEGYDRFVKREPPFDVEWLAILDGLYYVNRAQIILAERADRPLADEEEKSWGLV